MTESTRWPLRDPLAVLPAINTRLPAILRPFDAAMEAETATADPFVIASVAGHADRYAALNDAADGVEAEWLLFVASDSAEAAQTELPSGADGVAAWLRPDGSLLVRRAVFESLGGFAEGIREAGEHDLLLRVAELGHKAIDEGAPRPGGAASRWLLRRARDRPEARPASRAPARLWARIAASNRIAARPPDAAGASSLVLFTDAFPARSETFIAAEIGALAELGWAVRVESSARPTRIDRSVARSVRIDYLEDEPPLRGLLDLVRLAVRHPFGCLRDLLGRRAWSREEEPWPLRALAPAARRLGRAGERHVHVHFAAGAALHALRLARITGISWSVVGHGYDVFAEPRNLAAKLAAADLILAPCEYTARHLRSLLAPERRDRLHVIVMGVDPETFRRRRPYAGGRTVAAVGRLVEKKGFAHLVHAAALLEAEAPLDGVLIAGDGPLRAELEASIAAAGLSDRVRIVEAWGASAVKDLLEGADLFAMPSVIAADGDRDAMPVVVKEAMAMEIPIVASDAVGLPELVSPECGALVRPGDPHALAGAIRDLLARSPQERAAIGARGRARVVECCDVDEETAKLAALVESLRRR